MEYYTIVKIMNHISQTFLHEKKKMKYHMVLLEEEKLKAYNIYLGTT